jgi:hypothetical protein
MRERYAAGVLTVLVIVTVLTSGCINPASFGAAPIEVPPTYQIVHETEVATPVQTPTVAPTAAIKQAPVATPAPIPAVVSTTSDHVSKYADYNPARSLTPMGTALISTGGLNTRVDIYVNSTDDNRTVNLPVNVTLDGRSTNILLMPGNYTAVLPDKYDNRTEEHAFLIAENSVTYVAFNGYSYRASSGGGCGR